MNDMTNNNDFDFSSWNYTPTVEVTTGGSRFPQINVTPGYKPQGVPDGVFFVGDTPVKNIDNFIILAMRRSVEAALPDGTRWRFGQFTASNSLRANGYDGIKPHMQVAILYDGAISVLNITNYSGISFFMNDSEQNAGRAEFGLGLFRALEKHIAAVNVQHQVRTTPLGWIVPSWHYTSRTMVVGTGQNKSAITQMAYSPDFIFIASPKNTAVLTDVPAADRYRSVEEIHKSADLAGWEDEWRNISDREPIGGGTVSSNSSQPAAVASRPTVVASQPVAPAVDPTESIPF